MRRLVVLLFVGTLGCEATIPNDTFACGSGECPPGFECVDAFCVREGGRRDGSVDASLDAPDDTGMDAPIDAIDPDVEPIDVGTDANCGCGEHEVCVLDECCHALASVAGNDKTICAITTGDLLLCWGANVHSQVGSGGAVIEMPSEITGGPARWRQVDTGGGLIYDHTCAISAAGGLYCWGANMQGQLGLADREPRERPTEVTLPAGAEWTDITTANQSTCGIHDGQLYCWGEPRDGRLGFTPVPDEPSTSPIRLTTDSDWSDVDCDGATCCAIRSGLLFCWGRNAEGQVGIGDTSSVPTPTEIDLGAPAASVSCGEQHCCALTTTNLTYCWGAADDFQLGVSEQSAPSVAAPVVASSSISAGKLHTCTIASGEVWCWGANADGQLGIGSNMPTLSPRSTELTAISSIAAGNGHTCAIDTAGALHCWGLEPGTEETRDVPTPLCVPLAL